MRPKIKKMVFDELADNFQVVNEQEQASSVGGFQNGCFWHSLAFLNSGGYAGYGFCISANNAAALALAQGYYENRGFHFDSYEYGGFSFRCSEVKRNVANSVLSPGASSGILLTFNPSLVNINWNGGYGYGGGHGGPTHHTVIVTYIDGQNSILHLFCPQSGKEGTVHNDKLKEAGSFPLVRVGSN